MLTPAWTELRPHRQQHRLWTGPERFVAVCSGRGSGKTELARRRLAWFLSVRKPWPDPEYFYVGPTAAHARRIGWEKLKALVPPEWLAGEPNESRMELKTKFGSTLRVFTGEKPIRMEGLQYDGGVIDESSDQPPRMFDLNIRPALIHREGWCWRIGVPKRFGQGAIEYREVYEDYEKRMGDGVHAAYSWPSDDIISTVEMAGIEATTDPKDVNEQYRGVWEDVSGTVYYCFDEVASVRDDFDYDRGLPVFVGSDFNVDPMAWVLFHIRDDEVQVFDEVWLHDTNTESTLNRLHERYGDHKGGWHFFGDATGQSRKTSARMSDYAYIRNDVRFSPSKIRYPRANPPVADRVAAVNAMLRAANGKRRLFIHKRCAHLIRDLGYLTYRRGTRDIDDRDPKAKHITDALGYPIHYMFPVRSRIGGDEKPQVGIGTM